MLLSLQYHQNMKEYLACGKVVLLSHRRKTSDDATNSNMFKWLGHFSSIHADRLSRHMLAPSQVGEDDQSVTW